MVFSAVVFLATIGVSALVVGDQTRYYFTELLGDASRVGPIGTSFNQSWRGGISRILGHDAGYGPIVVVAIAVTAVLAVLAWRALGGADDRLGAIVIVQLFGLLLSPISWTHHWVWVLPLMIWLLHGPLRDRLGARILGWGWLALTIVGVPWLLSFAQPTIWVISRPWYLAWAGLIYIVATLVTLAWIAVYWPTIPSISRAISTSLSVMPPSECVTSAKVTVRQRISMSGWWSFCSARSPTRRTASMPSRNAGNLIDRRSAPSLRSQPLRSGSAAST